MSRAEDLLAELGITMDPQLFELALTHRSYAYENGGLPTNERLEFLGDAVLGVVVTSHLYHRFPELPEGRLAKLRAAVVNAHALAGIARYLELGPQIRLGRGEQTTGGSDKSSILADTLEAFIAAVYLSAGREDADLLVHRLFDPLIERAAALGAGLDWKTSLQELMSSRGQSAPVYHVDSAGPDHAKVFTAEVEVAGRRFGPGLGRSKKLAEQGAAEAAFIALSGGSSDVREGPADPKPEAVVTAEKVDT